VEQSTSKTMHLAGKGAHVFISQEPHTDTTARRRVGQGTRTPCTSREKCTYFYSYKNIPTHTLQPANKQKCGTRHQNTLHSAGKGAHVLIPTKLPRKHCQQAEVWNEAPENPALSRERCTRFDNYKTPTQTLPTSRGVEQGTRTPST